MGVTPRRSARSGERWTLALLGLLAVLIFLMLVSRRTSFVQTPGEAWVGHVLASAGLTFVVSFAYFVVKQRRMDLLALIWICVALTITIEIAQLLSPNRRIELADVSAGLLGVLGAAMILDGLLRIVNRRLAVAAMTGVAIMAAVALTAVVVLRIEPQTVFSVHPDGNSCPLSKLDGDGRRLTLGDPLAITDGCLETEVGGLGLLGPASTRSLGGNAVLVSSQLDELRSAIAESGQLTIRVQIHTQDFSADAALNTVLSLAADENRQLLILRTRGSQVLASGPPRGRPEIRASVQAGTLRPDTTHIIEVHLSVERMGILIDGAEVADVAIDPRWFDDLDTYELVLLIGNGPLRGLPFGGTINWLEIESR